MSESGQRGKILQAYADLLVEQGDRGATVDAVAARCGLSKAGLLHHYRSKASLNQALFEELEVQAAEDVRRLQLDPPSAISSYITSSLEVSSPLERLIVAVYRLAQGGNEDAIRVLRGCRRAWMRALTEAVGDPALARLVLLVADGLEYNIVLGDEVGDAYLDRGAISGILRLLESIRTTAAS